MACGTSARSRWSFARHIALIRPSTLPRTTSGKIQRNLARKLWLEGKLSPLVAEAT